MYEYIKGIFKSIEKEYIVIECGNIGYKIFTSGSTISNMPAIDQQIKIYTHQIVREDFIGLYGFLTKDEISMFNLLISINGVGPKAALSLMSIANVSTLKYAIITDDDKLITKAPGIGKKTAQRIILELKDKIALGDAMPKGATISDIDIDNEKLSEAVGALIALGYSDKEAEKAIEKADRSKSVEDIIKECLKILMG
ncbi:ATP-dependent DNA helicase RuvA [Clostridium sulfidigenes]|uniref:Holliday junction branch migration complex subunit RuvA n=1 Tax=Clostridium sulfidigenes TaxID=318464 RepID=A0A084J949_9CLOT|nr:Holliday junction branch migration protein RuvA [Clostridium sulfidigenes]KEZ85483.1 ATP-dependent DNA helicase RuvA [Clostridium sulfidigenes]